MSNIVTCFSFKLNGYVNYRRPNAPTPATIARGRVIAFPRETAPDFAYAVKEHAEADMPPDPTLAAIPFTWAKHLPKMRNEE